MHEWRRAMRRQLRRPASAAAIVITVALGIGVSAGMFSVLHGVVLRALPYPDADRLVRIYTDVPSRGPARGGLTRAEVLEGLPDLPGFAARQGVAARAAVLRARHGPDGLPADRRDHGAPAAQVRARPGQQHVVGDRCEGAHGALQKIVPLMLKHQCGAMVDQP